MRVAAFYFPQFHTDPALEEWFGCRGSDWENVRSATPRNRGQRILTPGELGEYDLVDPAVRAAQRKLAQIHGVDAFCYYHYWSDKQRLLEVVERSILAEDLASEMPFFLCWANHDWYRALTGGGKECLRPQSYSAGLFAEHAAYLRCLFAHPAYLTFGGRPLMIVYEPLASPEIAGWVRELKASAVLSPLLLGVEWEPCDREAILNLGFDGTVAPIPHLSRMVLPGSLCRSRDGAEMQEDVVIEAAQLDQHLNEADESAWKAMRDGQWRIPATYVGWDNSPRRRTGATIVVDNTPAQFRARVTKALVTARHRAQPIVLINAWNEWGESCVLEPSREFGRGFLEALAAARASEM